MRWTRKEWLNVGVGLAIVALSALSAYGAWPCKQAVLFVAPVGMECEPCDVLKADLVKCKAEVSAENDAHFIVRPAPPELKQVPVIVYFDENGKAIGRHVGYGYNVPYEQRLPELRKIVRQHPMYRVKRPPPAPPVEEASVASLDAPVRTADLREIADNGTVSVSPNGRQIQAVQYFAYAGDCGGGGGGVGGGGGDFFTPPQSYSYAMPYSDCSGAQSYSVPYSDCGGGGGIGGGGDYFTPPAQSAYFMPQQYANYGLSYARPYVVRYVPRATMPQFASGGINNWSLINIQPQLGFGLGGLFSQRSYRSPFAYASYSPRRMYCGPNGCVMY